MNVNGGEEPGSSTPPPGNPTLPQPLAPLDPLDGAGEPVPAFAGPDVTIGAYRGSVFWPLLTTVFSVLSVFFLALIFGPLGIVSGLIGVSRAERFSRTALAFAVACMLAGLILHALTHNHHSLTTGNYYFD